MSYLNAFNLTKEPFSNTPDPEFFYPARLHRKCIQQLEIAIRLGRGLNIVLGDVGAGKTTLCRQLLRTLDADDKIETYLMLDPGFEDLFEFLAYTARLFGCAPAEAGAGVWDMKEAIKTFLFDKGVAEDRQVVLIIDEGQKLTEVNLEALREFLNYETNDRKLMQIVIFAQKEFEGTIAKHPNFADRINFLHVLGPLNYRETRAMIDYRLDQAGLENGAARMFTRPALWTLHRVSGGFPRKIINISHLCVLNSLINGQRCVTRSAVRNCHKMSASANFRKKRMLRPVSAMVFLMVILAFYGLLALSDTFVSLESGRNKAVEPRRLTSSPMATTDALETDSGALNVTSTDIPPATPRPDGLAVPVSEANSSVHTEGPPSIEPSEYMKPSSVISKPAVVLPVRERQAASSVEKTPELPAPVEQKEKRKNYISGASGTIVLDDDIADPAAKPPPLKNEEQQSEVAATPGIMDGEIGEIDGPAPHLATMKIRPGDNIYTIITRIYGDFAYRRVKLFMKYNPEISDTNLVKMGQTLAFPVFPLSDEISTGFSWVVRLARTGSFDEAYQIAAGADSIQTKILVVPDSADGSEYEVIINQYFKNKVDAARFLTELDLPENYNAALRSTNDDGPM